MAHYNTVLSQIVKVINRHEFESLARLHHQGQKLRTFNRWSRFIAMSVAQLASRKSLRDIAPNLAIQKNKLYHPGLRKTSRATLARVNENQPYSLYEALFQKLLTPCKHYSPGHKFKLKKRFTFSTQPPLIFVFPCFPGPNSGKPNL